MNPLARTVLGLLILTQCMGMSKLTAEVTRAAFDVGSGSIKMTVATVDERSGRPKATLFSEHTEVLLGHDYKKSLEGTLSKEILDQARNALLRYRDIAKDHGAEQLVGIATAVFRESTNGSDFIEHVRKEIGIDLHLISQEEEGRIGFLTAVAGSGKQPNEVIAWDSGAASFQITTMNERALTVYEGPWGASKAQAAMIKDVQGFDFSEIQTANPATMDNVLALQSIIVSNLPNVPAEIQFDVLNGDQSVVGIGGINSIFNIAKITIGTDFYTKEQVWKAIEGLIGSSDKELDRFPQREMVIPKLTLLVTVMEHFGIHQLHYAPTCGTTFGIFMSPQFW